MNNLPSRKQIRIPKYDYTSRGAYFVTVCTDQKRNLLSSISKVGCSESVGRITLSEIGETVNHEIQILGTCYIGVSVENYVIMPNHIHLIIQICEDGAPAISHIIQQWKGAITKKLGYKIWQRSFYEHIIRNQSELNKYQTYIAENPLRWVDDEYYRDNLA